MLCCRERFARLINVSVLVVSVWLLGAGRAEALSISIDQPHVDITSAPGSAVDGAIKVKNKGSEPVAVSVNVEDWVYDAEGKRDFRQPGTTQFSCAKWLEISPLSATVLPGEEKDFNYILRTPQDATGGHYAVIFFESAGAAAGEEGIEGMGVRIVGRIGSVIYQETEGRVNKAGSVSDLVISKPAENRPLLVTYKFTNSGNAFIKFKGIVNVTDRRGNVYGKAESAKETGTLPGDVREDEIKWFGSLKKGEYDIILTIDGGETMAPVVTESKLTLDRDVP